MRISLLTFPVHQSRPRGRLLRSIPVPPGQIEDALTFVLAVPAGFEPATPRFEVSCSSSFGGIFGHDASFGFVNINPADQVGLTHSEALTSNGGLVGGEIGYDVQTGAG